MFKFSNGDIRIILQLARKILDCILKSREQLEKDELGGWKIKREELIRNLSVKKEENPPRGIETEKWKIIDLHADKSISINKNDKEKIGNSLLQNVLEAIAIFNDPYDENYYKVLNELGHTNKKIEEAFNYLYWQRMIEEAVIITGVPALFGKYTYKENIRYTLTDKGKLYLDEIIDWSEYKNKFSETKKSVYDILGVLGKDQDSKEVLEFAATICSFSKRRQGIYLKVNTQNFFNFFLKKFGERYTRIVFVNSDKLQKIQTMNINKFITILKRLDIINEYNLEKRNYFSIKIKKTLELAIEENNHFFKDIMVECVFNPNIFAKDEIKEFINENVEFTSRVKFFR
jgi:hypothetical protein